MAEDRWPLRLGRNIEDPPLAESIVNNQLRFFPEGQKMLPLYYWANLRV